jgi:hypothetical protein
VDNFWKAIIRRQFDASVDMLENALRSCPETLWDVQLWQDPTMPRGFSEFWYILYHSLFWLDLYLSGAVEGFSPPDPFTLDELDPAGVLPVRQYTREELQSYLNHCRRKCRTTIAGLSDAEAQRRCKFSWGEVSFGELILDNMRHVQEHGAQLNMILGQKKGLQSKWVAKSNLPAESD